MVFIRMVRVAKVSDEADKSSETKKTTEDLFCFNERSVVYEEVAQTKKGFSDSSNDILAREKSVWWS